MSLNLLKIETKARGRCEWSKNNALMQTYHDNEWGVPQRDSRMLWEMLMLEGFQAGLSWLTVLKKREAFRQAFADFDPVIIANFNEKDIARLMNDEKIIRSRAKIDATILAAKIYCEMKAHGENFSDFCWAFTAGKVQIGKGTDVPVKTPLSEEISKELKRRGFKFVGPIIVYAWMQAIGIVNDHALDCYCR